MNTKFIELKKKINRLSDVVWEIANMPNDNLKTLDTQLLIAEYHSTIAELIPRMLPLVDKLIDFTATVDLTERALLEEDILELLNQL